jgi:hypothetical protein
MNVFQYCAVLGLTAALIWEVVRALRRQTRFGMWLVRILTYAAAAMMIAFPDLVQQLATVIGIHRGSDLVMYTFVLLFVFLAFVFYGRLRQLELHITRLIRRDAIEHAKRGHWRLPAEETVSARIIRSEEPDAIVNRGAESPLEPVSASRAAGPSDPGNAVPGPSPRKDIGTGDDAFSECTGT